MNTRISPLPSLLIVSLSALALLPPMLEARSPYAPPTYNRIHAPASLDGYVLSFDICDLQQHRLDSEELLSAFDSKFVNYEHWDWRDARRARYPLGVEKMRFSEQLCYTYDHSSTSRYYRAERIAPHQIFLSLGADERDDSYPENWILLDFKTAHSGIAVWGGEEMFWGNIYFKLTRPQTEPSRPTLRPLPPVEDEGYNADSRRFDRLSRRLLKENTLENWEALKEFYNEHYDRLSARQRELFPIAYRCTQSFRSTAMTHYAKRLTELLPALMAGQSVNLAHVSGNTALHYAAAMKNRALCVYLVEHGARINELNEDEQTPLDCLGTSRTGLDRWMIQHHARRNQPRATGHALLLEYAARDYMDTPAAYVIKHASERLVANFVNGLSGDLNLLLSCYAQRVDYFDQGIRSRDEIRRDNIIFNKRYPRRQFQSQDISVSRIHLNSYSIHFKAPIRMWTSFNLERRITLEYTLTAEWRDDRFTITSIRSKRI